MQLCFAMPGSPNFLRDLSSGKMFTLFAIGYKTTDYWLILILFGFSFITAAVRTYGNSPPLGKGFVFYSIFHFIPKEFFSIHVIGFLRFPERVRSREDAAAHESRQDSHRCNCKLILHSVTPFPQFVSPTAKHRWRQVGSCTIVA